MKRSEAILRALDEATEPQTPEEIAAAIDVPDEGKNVGQLLCALRIKGHAVDSEQRGKFKAWIITEQGREFLTDILAERQDDAASAATATRRVMAADRARRDPDGPPPINHKARPIAHAVKPGVPEPPTQDIAVRSDGSVLVIENDRVTFTLGPALALNVAAVVRRLRAEVP